MPYDVLLLKTTPGSRRSARFWSAPALWRFPLGESHSQRLIPSFRRARLPTSRIFPMRPVGFDIPRPRVNYPLVLARLSKWLIVLALMLSIGAHWAALQSMAWFGMIVSYSHDSSLTVAIDKTFDGHHPCCLCKAIAAGKKSERKQEASLQKDESKFAPIKESFVLAPPSHFELLSLWENPPADSLTQKPPLPPPKELLA